MKSFAHLIQLRLRSLWSVWDRFWFGPRDSYALGAFRCVFSLVLFCMYLVRSFDLKLFYFNSGMLTAAAAKSFYRESFAPWFFLFPSQDHLIVIMNAVFLILLFLMFLGLVGRSLTWLVFLLHVGFIQRNYAITFGVDSVATLLLFYLCFCRHNEYFNVRKFFGHKTSGKPQITRLTDPLTAMGYRLIQVQICVIYAYTGWDKLKGATWWNGSALWYVMGNHLLVPFDFSFFYHVPGLVALMGYATLIFEIYFAFAMLLPVPRRIWLTVGVFMHVGIAIFMGLISFSAVMLSSYLLFISLPKPSAFLGINHKIQHQGG